PGDYSATIDWGDNSGTSQAVLLTNGNGIFQVMGSHAYATPGTYQVNTSIIHENGIQMSASTTAIVNPNGNGSGTGGSNGTGGGSNLVVGTGFFVVVDDAGLTSSGTPVTASEGQP